MSFAEGYLLGLQIKERRRQMELEERRQADLERMEQERIGLERQRFAFEQELQNRPQTVFHPEVGILSIDPKTGDYTVKATIDQLEGPGGQQAISDLISTAPAELQQSLIPYSKASRWGGGWKQAGRTIVDKISQYQEQRRQEAFALGQQQRQQAFEQSQQQARFAQEEKLATIRPQPLISVLQPGQTTPVLVPRSQAAGLTPMAAPTQATTARLSQQVSAFDSTIASLRSLAGKADVLSSLGSRAKIKLALGPAGFVQAAALASLSPEESAVMADFNALSEKINSIRGPLNAAGFRGALAFDKIQSQAGSPLMTPDQLRRVLRETIVTLAQFRQNAAATVPQQFTQPSAAGAATAVKPLRQVRPATIWTSCCRNIICPFSNRWPPHPHPQSQHRISPRGSQR